MSKLTKSAGLFSTSSSPSQETLSLSQKFRSDRNELNLDLQPVQDNQKIRSTLPCVPYAASACASKQKIKRSLQFNIKKNLACKLFFLACIQGLAGLHQAYAATYYVSPAGTDANSGTALTTPVKTINRALSMARNSGDVIYVRTGTYVESLNIQQSGITLSAYQNDKPVIDGQSQFPNGDWGSLVSVSGNNNTISGFEVTNSNINGAHAGGYGVWVGGHHNTISKMNVHHTWENGVLIQGDYSIVEDSSVWQAARQNFNGSGNGWSGGLNAARNRSSSALKPGITSYATIRRNKVYNNWGEGLSCYEVDHCILEDNIVYDNFTVNLYLSDATNSLVQRNIVYVSSAPAISTKNSSHPGICLFDEVASVPRSTNNIVINNLLYNVDFNAFSWTQVANSGLRNVLIANNTIVDGSLQVGSGGSPAVVNTNSQIRNNIILGNASVSSNSGLTFSHNNWSATPPSAAAASTDIVRDPQIARTGTAAPGALTPAYFKILESSPVIDAGTSLSNVTTDFFKNNRDASPDIGGHEFNASGGTPSPSPSPTDSAAPSAPSGLGATAGSATQVKLVWNAATDDVGVTGYKIYRNGTAIKTSTVTNFTDTAVTGGTTYNYTVNAYDAAGNLSASSNTATVKTPQATATATVNISSKWVGKITARTATINWTTNIPSTAVISYTTQSAAAAANNFYYKVPVSNLATSHSVQLTNLYNNTTYYYKITATNGSTTAVSGTSTFKTKLY